MERRSVAAHAWPRDLRPVDALVAGGLFALAMADVLTTDEYAGGTLRLALAAALQTLPLAARRFQPVAAVSLSLLGVVVETAGVSAYGGVYGLLGFLVLVHAVSRWATGNGRRLAVALLLAGMLGHLLSQTGDGPLGLLGDAVMVSVLSTAAWLVGRWSRTAEERESSWQQEQDRIIEAERGRISRELHDVVGHALAGISLTAGAAERQVGTREPETAEALALIRTLSRDAASDVRRLVGLLRQHDDEATAPQPTLEVLPALVERARAAGLDVESHERGTAVPISGGLHLAAYRVVQEGLTNALKHAAGSRVRVELDWSPGALSVSVTNTAGSALTTVGPDGGHGLAGLGERVSLFDGSLNAAPTDDGGFRLTARFPLA